MKVGKDEEINEEGREGLMMHRNEELCSEPKGREPYTIVQII